MRHCALGLGRDSSTFSITAAIIAYKPSRMAGVLTRSRGGPGHGTLR